MVAKKAMPMKKQAIDRLQAQLRELIEADRVQIVKFYCDHIKEGLERFLENRKPNKTIWDVYGRYPEPIGIREATTYEQAMKDLGGASFRVTKPPFDVTFRPDADEIIHRLATKEVEMMVQTFLQRATDKLGPVVERHPDVEMESVSRSGFRSGAWVGNISFTFKKGMAFNATMKVITNFSKHGQPFGQYPMTFWEARLAPDFNTLQASVSIEDIWGSIGYGPPPPEKKPRWTKLVPGCVVIHEGKRHFISTAGVVKKLGIPQDAEQIARVEAGSSGCRIEYADGRTEHYKYTPEEERQFEDIGRQQSYNKEGEARRQFAYKKFFPDVDTSPKKKTGK